MVQTSPPVCKSYALEFARMLVFAGCGEVDGCWMKCLGCDIMSDERSAVISTVTCEGVVSLTEPRAPRISPVSERFYFCLESVSPPT